MVASITRVVHHMSHPVDQQSAMKLTLVRRAVSVQKVSFNMRVNASNPNHVRVDCVTKFSILAVR